MQIHELTFGAKKNPIAEGLWDTIKAATVWEPGQTFAQAKAKVRDDAAVAQIAKKAQASWQNYEQQLKQYVSKLPAPVAKPAPQPVSSGLTPGRRIQVPYQAPGQTTPSYYYKTSQGWTNELGQAVTDPKSIQGLEAAAVKGGREQPDPNYVAPDQTTVAAGKRKRIKKSTSFVREQADSGSALDAYIKRTDGRYEQALKSFVQKNLLSGMQYSRLANAQEIDQLIKTMSLPQNADPKIQQPLWQQLALAAAVAQTVPQSAGGVAAEPDSKTDNTDQATTSNSMPEIVKQALAKNQISTTTLNQIGQLLITNYSDGNNTIRSTGNSSVDALLQLMGFRSQ